MHMTEKMNTRLGDLKARQLKGEHMKCPRCGADTMKEPVHTNALSRVADIYICDAFISKSNPMKLRAAKLSIQS